MAVQVYNPFERFNFSNRNCFLTGTPVDAEEERIQVFPQWLMTRYALEERPFKLLDESITTYKDLKIPCSTDLNNQFLIPLEEEIAEAFDKGYDAVKALDPIKIFQWAGKLLYGMIFNEVQSGIKMQYAQGEQFVMSQAIRHKFSHLLLMLQGINHPIIFDEFTPFSLFLFKVDNAPDEFVYRDEINTLTFSIRLRDMGLIICLQDNTANLRYHKQLLDKIGETPLHPIQFEEMCARVFYSAYLFNRLPEYNLLPVGEELYIEAMPLRGMDSRPLFDHWQGKTFGQVLENFWKKWGFLLLEIIKNPEKPMTFLTREDGELIPAGEVGLPA
ncbi:hypothetical protein [Mucilaginibacter myungsuensis]|uniref:Uncharacterized protein n=1 Tax=Mucilaginibacter myungsuensis TaxID=649104 RepID=A0A929L1Q9_9SPHI|nr:hypothetical protein [Mucilaginibacter myungsuensis]MBE9664013.1 hypothetical protein [Mucilaginibacter myungsuensis]MDN3601192.1 hypothetical protein [Mucilaginibacter myungsuensis]